MDPGDRLGVYELLAPIGSGGMGDVYKARDSRLNRIVAIKVLSTASVQSPRAHLRFKQEAITIAALNHPHICTLYDVGHERGIDFLVMEFVDGETLAARLARGAMPIAEAISCATDIARAVDAAHRRNVIHRDLKPSNVMLTKAGAKLLDFGLAKLYREEGAPGDMSTITANLSQEGAVVGTLRYMAPEVLKGEEADARSDVFSLGAVLYEMVAGQPPFTGTNNARIIAAILGEEPPSLTELRPEVPPSIEWITRTCLAKDPDERWQDAREVVRQLTLLEQGHASPITPTMLLRRERPARRAVPALAMVALVAILTVAIVVLMARPRSPTVTPTAGDALNVPHVVVLPCRPIGEVSVEERSQCDGMAAMLTATLAKLTAKQALQVTPASEVYQRRIASAADARRELGATLALEGSFVKGPDGIRVTYALVDTVNARQVDARTVQGRESELFRLQDELVEWVAGALHLTLDAAERQTEQRTTRSMDAYAFAMQGRGYLLDFHRAGAVDIAIGLFRRSLEADAGYAVAHAGLGESYWRKYEATKDPALVALARASCRQALNLDAQLPAAHVCAGTIASGTGEYEEAIVLLERALQIDGTSDDAYRLLARAFESLGRPDAALATYRRAVELRPQYWATHVWLAAFHRGRGDLAEAAREYERAVELTPDNAPVRGILAGMYMFLGRYDDALEECKRSLALSPTSITFGVLGGTQYRMRRFTDAVASQEQAMSLLEDFRTAGNVGRAYYWAGRKDRAQASFERAIALGLRELEVNPRNDEALVALADYYARVGRPREALAHLGRARLENPHFMFFAAMVHNLLGDRALARAWLDKAMAAGLPPAEVTAWIDLDNLLK